MMDAMNLVNPSTGRAVPNHIVITDGCRRYIFKSYRSRVCAVDGDANTITFGQHWDYSVTTRKWLYVFLSQYVGWKGAKKDVVNKAIAFGAVQVGGMAWTVRYDGGMQ